MLLLELLSASIVPALLLILVLALTLHIIYLNKSFKHRIQLVVAIRMREEALAKELAKPLPSELEGNIIYNHDEKKPERRLRVDPKPIKLYNGRNAKDLDIIE
jgi:hypothetical protein